jgi:hypothetical protein
MFQLVRRWDGLSAEYKAKMPALSSMDAWSKTFAEHTIADSRARNTQALGERG